MIGFIAIQDIKVRHKKVSVTKRAVLRDEESGATKIFSDHGKINVIVQTVSYKSSIKVNIITENSDIIPKSEANFSVINVHIETGVCAFDFKLTTTCQNESCAAFYVLVSYINQEEKVIYILSMPLVSYSKYNIKTGQSNEECCLHLSLHTFQSEMPVNGLLDMKDNNSILNVELKRDDICYFDIVQHPNVVSSCNTSQVAVAAVSDIIAFQLSDDTEFCTGGECLNSLYTRITWIYQWIITAGDHKVITTVRLARSFSQITNEWITSSETISMHSNSSTRSRGQLEKQNRHHELTFEEIDLEMEFMRDNGIIKK
jgi:hypothetical protein